MPFSNKPNLKISGVRQVKRYLPVNRLHWLLVGASLVATVIAWKIAAHSAEERIKTRFKLQADYSVDLFEEQLHRYAEMLKSGVGFVAGSEKILPAEWRQFTQRLDLKEQFPAIGGIGVVYRVEISELDEFVRTQRLIQPGFEVTPAIDPAASRTREYVLPISLISPERLEKAITGLDVAREQRRRDAITNSVKTGKVQITAPIRPEAEEDPGFVLVAPIFKSNRPATQALRQSEFIGAVVASVVTKNLAQGILESGIRQVVLKVSDNAEIMYNEFVPENKDVDPQPLMTSSRTISVFGRDWRFDIHSTKTFRVENNTRMPTMILVTGLIIDALLLLLFTHMSRSNQRATAFGNSISEKYKLQSEQLHQINTKLEDRNSELETFSYLVSHDLKTPLRGVGFLADCIKEDLEQHQPGNPLPPEVIPHIARIKKQVILAQGLIHGVLQYSGLGIEKENTEKVDVRELLNTMPLMLSVDETQLKLVGEFPTFETYQIQLTQVFMNLIGNGFKYHHGQGLAVVTVGTTNSPLKNFYRFTVSDNGPGINPDYHEKIFEPFSTLQPKDQSMSSGVGLAIVKKLVVQNGGDIEVSSDVSEEAAGHGSGNSGSTSHGTRFSFDWPCSVADKGASSKPMARPKAA
ncbi:MAG: CHASE domain-containing protein [Granulosicoccus sp.]